MKKVLCLTAVLVLVFSSISFSQDESIYLSFRSNYGMEAPIDGSRTIEGHSYDGWDGLNVQISVAGSDTFTPLIPESGYNCNSLYGFGSHGIYNMPGWGGSSSGWEAPVFNLDDYSGQDVEIRFAMGTDVGYSTLYDSSWYGWIVDDIHLYTGSDSDTIYYNPANDTSKMTLTNPIEPSGDYWEWTTEDAHSDSHSWKCDPHNNLENSLISQPISVPSSTDTTVIINYFLKLGLYDALDTTASGPSLSDYISCYISPDSGRTWDWLNGVVRSTDAFMTDSFVRVDRTNSGNVIYGEERIPSKCVIPDSSRSSGSIMIKFKVLTDGETTSGDGPGAFVDDVSLKWSLAVHNDVKPTDMLAGPTNIGEETKFTCTVSNEGMDSQSTIPGFFVFQYYDSSSSEWTEEDRSMFPSFPSLDPDSTTEIVTTFTPSRATAYRMLAITNLSSDERDENDTLYYYFNVYDSTEIYNAGYDDGEVNYFTADTSDGRISRINAVGINQDDTLRYDQAAVGFTPPYDEYKITHVQAYTGTSPVEVKVLGVRGGTPGSEMQSDIFTTDSSGWVPHKNGWHTFDIRDTARTDSLFFISITNADPSSYILALADTSSPHDGHSWLSYDGSWVNLATMEDPAYNPVDFMIRAVVKNVGESAEYAPDSLTVITLSAGGDTFFTDNMEDSTWKTLDETYAPAVTNYWHLDDYKVADGTAWWCADTTIGGYRNSWLQYMTTDTISIPEADVEERETNNLRSHVVKNYPDPFHRSTTISYSIQTASSVQLSIYDVNGELVKNLVDKKLSAGDYSTTWNGKTKDGSDASGGIYFYKLSTDTREVKEQMLLME